VSVTDWAHKQPSLAHLPIAYFGASTGAAAAIAGAAARPELIRAIVSRGGRPDLAEGALAHVRAPTLLIVGEADREVLSLNRHVFDVLPCDKQLEVIPGASHLFEEPGALEQVAQSAATWIRRHAEAARSARATG
jgi:pimeloyl-ACP methyl ester carboxylesterase